MYIVLLKVIETQLNHVCEPHACTVIMFKRVCTSTDVSTTFMPASIPYLVTVTVRSSLFHKYQVVSNSSLRHTYIHTQYLTFLLCILYR